MTPIPVPSDAHEGDRRRSELEQLIAVMAPAVAADGGELVLVAADVDTGVVTVALRGACSSCAVSAVTLEAGVERVLRQRLDWVTEVRGSVEEAADWDASASLGSGGWRPANPAR